MSIVFRTVRNRQKAVWLDVEPPLLATQALTDRGFAAARCTKADLQADDFLSGVSTVIFTQLSRKPMQVVDDLAEFATRLLDHGCQVVVRGAEGIVPTAIRNILELKKLPRGLGEADDPRELGSASDPLGGDPPLPYVRYFAPRVSWNDIVNFIHDCPAGPAPNQSLKISVPDRVDKKGVKRPVRLSRATELLLQRAYWDCREVHLEPMPGGRGSVAVYKAKLIGNAPLGSQSRLHFVKIANRTKIFREYRTYELAVGPHVPFHLHPHLVRDRCWVGAHYGVIVGDYVEESESLRASAYDDRSRGAIACLFDRTLAGWYQQAFCSDTSLSDLLLAQFPTMIVPARMERARQLGATREPEALRDLFARCDKGPTWVGPIHGDLHAGNVRVRGADAIIIDVFAHATRPVLLDAASLEVSLLVDCLPRRDNDVAVWIASIKALYDHAIFGWPATLLSPNDKLEWLHSCIRQVRRYAHQWELQPGQYSAALAFALLSKAQKDSQARDPDASRRAAAYVLAEQLLIANFGATQAVKALPSAAPNRTDAPEA
jgi:hypothetical protein